MPDEKPFVRMQDQVSIREDRMLTKANEKVGSVNRGTPCDSGLCGYCRVDCQGRCETWLSSMLGRATLFPNSYGNASIGCDDLHTAGVSYNTLRIRGTIFGSKGFDQKQAATGDIAYCDTRLETAIGATSQTKSRFPLVIGALSRNPVVDKYWNSFAVGAALCGIPLVIGENVGGGDRKTEYSGRKITRLPDLDARIASYNKFHDDYGRLVVQLNVNDSHNGVGDYVAEHYGRDVTIEIKWGQGAKPINGEGLIRDLAYAQFMHSNGYCVRPNPHDPEAIEAFKSGKLKAFTRYTGLTYPALNSWEEVLEALRRQAEDLRSKGATHLALKTGGFGMADLALAIRAASELDFDMLTIDGSGGGTGMSPNDVVDSWGVPSILLHAKAREYAALYAAQGKKVVDLVLGGGLAKPNQIFKALALGGPNTKAVCMSRAFMVPAFLGCNIEGALYPDCRAAVNGSWDRLPKSVADIGTTPETIFAGYHAIRERLGADAMAEVPLGAIAMWTMCDRLGAGLQHHMAGARKFTIDNITVDDIASVNEETARATGIPLITEQEDAMARKILMA